MEEVLKDEKIRKILDKMRAMCSVRERCTSEVREKVSKLLTEDIISAVSTKIEEYSSRKRGMEVATEEPDKESIDRTRENIISALIASLTEDGFLSDSRYAAAFARDKAHLLGWGPQKIRYALLSKKLDEATVNEALALVDDSASANQLERLLRRKLESLTKKTTHPHFDHDDDPAGTDRTSSRETSRATTNVGSRAIASRNSYAGDSSAIREKLIRFALGRGYTLDSTLAALSKLPL